VFGDTNIRKISEIVKYFAIFNPSFFIKIYLRNLNNPNNMKQLLFFFLFSIIPSLSFAQALWPIAGAKTGDGIICKPQQYIGNDLDFEALIVTAKEGTPVVAPYDGSVYNLDICARQSWFLSKHWDMLEGTFNGRIKEILDSKDDIGIPAKYLSGMVFLRTSEGNIIHISGLRGDGFLKTGMMIHRGDTLGTAWYSCRSFKEPSIIICMYTSHFDPLDPMTPFGLKTTFVAPKKARPPKTLTPEQAKEDMKILLDAYKECYPSLYDVVTPEMFTDFESKAMSELEHGISYDDFYYLIHSAISAGFVHDSHLEEMTGIPHAGEEFLMPHLHIGFLNDSLFVTLAPKGNEKFLRKRIASINGIDAQTIIDRAKGMQAVFDQNSSGSRDMCGLIAWNYIYGKDVHTIKSQKIIFSDGSEYEDEWVPRYRVSRVPNPDSTAYHRLVLESSKREYSFKMLRDDVVLFSLNTFELNQIQVEDIADSLKALGAVPVMIIDLRNNSGGDEKVLAKLLSFFIIGKPASLKSYMKVKSDSTYKSFRYAVNFPQNEVFFSDFTAKKGADGYYLKDRVLGELKPDSATNYHGHLYILTGDHTSSAATWFPAFLVRNHRAVTVGRETRSGYHFITAEKFADIMLPNSKIQVRIPLVKCVFDEETVNARVPAGRGLIPDYEVPLTYEEYYTSEEDIILNRALELIDQGKYLGDNPFATKKNNGILHLVPLLIGLAILAAAVLVGIRIFRKPQ
jgi:Periplasmic protease